MKSFFDFNGRIEATRGARHWSWIKKTTCSYPHLNIISLTKKKALQLSNCKAFSLFYTNKGDGRNFSRSNKGVNV
ncbi:hypothetical protein J7E32_21530, partial [Bacillus sp. ISL-55]|nr:hypothetical protein [Bacillus sp. ISL-55]